MQSGGQRQSAIDEELDSRDGPGPLNAPSDFGLVVGWPMKPIIGVLHLKGESRADRLRRAQRELELYVEGGVDGVLVEDYFGEVYDVEAVLDWLSHEASPVPVGVNVLADYRASYSLAAHYGSAFIQIDSVAGHLDLDADMSLSNELEELRNSLPIPLLGGVRFKYQPVRSGRSLDEELLVGASRCDAIVVSGTATGVGTPIEKILEFRRTVGVGFPLIIGSGLTPESCREQLAVSDGAIVGSYFKSGHREDGELELQYIRGFMAAVDAARKSMHDQ